MNKEAKELIQEGLKLFSSYNRDTLKMFYRSAKENEADLSHLDKKYQTYTRAKAKGMFFDFALGFLDAVASAGSPIMVIDNTKSERYNEKKLYHFNGIIIFDVHKLLWTGYICQL